MMESFSERNKDKKRLGILGHMLLRLLILRLFGPTLALLMLTLGLTGFISHRSFDAQQIKLARLISNDVETFLYDAGNMLGSAARVADFYDEKQLSFYLKSFREGFAYFDSVYRLDNNGMVVVVEPHDSDFIGLDQSRQPFFLEAGAGQELHISRPFNSMRTGKPTVNLTLVLKNGDMMVAELNLGTFQDVVKKTHHEQSESTVVIVDQAGTYLAHPRSELIAQQARINELPFLKGMKEGEITSHLRIDDEWMLSSAKLISSTGWVVLIQVPMAVLYGPLVKAAVPVFFLCLGVWILMVLAFQKRFWRYVVLPLTDLSKTATAISSGDLERCVNIQRDDEIGIVARAFNSMTAQLREVIGNLEERVTQLTLTKEELRTQQEQLENIVKKRTAALTERTQQLEEQAIELSAAKKEAEKASKSKSEFLARMSHEIRTPLNAVTGLTNVVLKSRLTPEQRDYLSKVKIAGNNLLEVINDILDFSKVEAGHLELTHALFDLNDLMEQLSDLFSNRVAQKDLELIFAVSSDVPQKLTGDSSRLTQVLTNLIENAVKFTETGEIVVKVGIDDNALRSQRKVKLRFVVSDTGIGIADDMLPTLFDPFTQVDSSLTRTQQGAGLGLAICKRLVELMGGEIWAESTLGRGSVFTFMVEMEPQYEKQSRFSLPEDMHGLKALVVDDSATSCQILDELLTSLTFQVTTVNSGEKAIEVLQGAMDYPYELVLLDWKMEGMDGIETAFAIRNLINLGRPPIIIMVTAYGHELLQEQIDTTVVDRLMMKPIKASGMFNTIMELFGKGVPVKPRVVAGKTIDLKLAGRRVLVVEDSDLNRDVAVAILKEVGIDVEIAENGRIALDKVINAPKKYFDAVLMDIQMPEMDGFAATRKIRESKSENRNVCIIALTAHALKGEKEKCLEAGMHDYLAKPIDEKQLGRVLLKWIKPQREGEDSGEQTEKTGSSAPQAVLNVQEALNRLGGRRHIYNKALRRFITESGQADETLEGLLAGNDLEAASLTAHTVKGTASVIGAEDLNKIAQELEQTLRDNDQGLEGLLITFGSELEKTLEAVKEYLENDNEI